MQSFSYSSLALPGIFIAAIAALLVFDSRRRRPKGGRLKDWQDGRALRIFSYPMVASVPVWYAFNATGSFDANGGYRDVVYAGLIAALSALLSLPGVSRSRRPEEPPFPRGFGKALLAAAVCAGFTLAVCWLVVFVIRDFRFSSCGRFTSSSCSGHWYFGEARNSLVQIWFLAFFFSLPVFACGSVVVHIVSMAGRQMKGWLRPGSDAEGPEQIGP